MKRVKSFLNFISAVLIKALLSPIYLIGFLIPKNDKVWVFGAWSGKSFSDNSKALYLYANKQGKDSRPIWITRNNSVLKSLKNKSLEAYSFYSLKGLYFSLIAGKCVMSNSWIDLPLTSFLFFYNKKFIQLWHGTPLKKMDLKKGSLLKRVLRLFLINYLGKEYDLVFSSTKKNIGIYEKVFSINRERIKISGQPRIDLISSKKRIGGKKDFRKIILFMPTWREYEIDLFSGLNKDKFFDFLSKNNYLFVIKMHPNDAKKYKENFKHKNILFWDENKDIYPYLNNFNILITDYSSVYFDFLILDRPIIFFIFDIDRYSKENGFYYEYNSVTPGPKAKNWDEVSKFIQEAIKNDIYCGKRKRISVQFNKFSDYNNSERVFNLIKNER